MVNFPDSMTKWAQHCNWVVSLADGYPLHHENMPI